MKTKFTIAAICFVAVACMAAASSGSQIFSEETQASSRAVPTSTSFTVTQGPDAGAAMSLDKVDGFRLSVCAAEPGTNLGGSGSLRAWLYDSRSNEVMENKHLAWTVTATTHCQVFPDQEVKGPFDRVMYTTSALLVEDAGTLLPDAGTGAFIVRMRGWKVP
jgi:hypothetical protein